ncbi:MAG: hypothetical protein ACPLSP_07350, partial [Fervidicoccus fontis]
MITIGFHHVMEALKKRIAFKRISCLLKFRESSHLKRFYFPIHLNLIYLLFSLLLLAQFVPNVAYLQNKTPNWYTASGSWRSDYEGLLWIHKNIPPTDLILNDYSWAGLWILSFSYKNTTSNFYGSIVNFNRTLELNEIWKGRLYPREVYALLRKYNVSYIFTTSEWGYLRWWRLTGKPNEYGGKPLKPSQYIDLFNSYPFLELMFQSGNTAIYRVNRDFNADLGLLLDLSFQDVQNNITLDSSIYRNNGAIYGATRVISEIGSALSFNGKDDYVLVLDSVSLRLRDEFSIEFWVYLNDK